MAILNNIRGIKIWLKRKGYHNNTSDQIIKAYIKITGNKLKPITSFSNRPSNDNSFQVFSCWFGQIEKKHPVICSEFKNNNGNIERLKLIRQQLQFCYS